MESKITKILTRILYLALLALVTFVAVYILFWAAIKATTTAVIIAVLGCTLLLSLLYLIFRAPIIYAPFAYCHKDVTLSETVNEVSFLFRTAKHDIRVICGHIAHHLYDNPQITEALREALRNNVNIEFIFGDRDIDSNSTYIKNLARQEKIKLFKLPYRSAYHFAVVDKQHCRLESPHAEECEPEKAYIRFYSTFLSSHVNRIFEKLKQQSTIVDANDPMLI